MCVRLFVVAKIGNYPIFHQWENGRTNYGTSIFIHSYFKMTRKKNKLELYPLTWRDVYDLS